ncbi:Putative polyol transporter 2 [Talaromyces islandicus]|uniref:Putative polyol transporter 2 n=1 Tax=Talaromyces islandicus TaxID=28573 RepID=A0A0U1MA07_TALIS|nr:Putative polyol transporter 2 [Talaromyces islandicus]
MGLSPSVFRILVVGFVALGSTTYGYSSSIIATTLGQPSFLSYFLLDSRSNATQLEGAINGLFQAGGLVGCLSCIGTADWLGRKQSILIAALVTVVGGALQAGSVHIAMYLVFRFITGIGVGALVALVPLYQSEISPPKIRGFLVGIHGVMLCIGYALASWIGLGFYFVNASGSQWRLPLAIQCLPPLVLACGIFMLPESPRWLIDNDRIEDALRSFESIHAESDQSIANDHRALVAEFNLLQALIVHERQDKHTFSDMFRYPAMRKRCLIGFFVLFACQGTATLVINNYGPSLYASLGFDTVSQLLIQGGWITVCPIGNLLNSLIVDRVGRTRLLMAGFAGTVSALVGECITLSIYQRSGSRSAASAAVFFLFFHIACFSVTCDATSYIYASEIFPTPVRAKGLSISVAGLFVATIIFLQCAPTAFAQIGWKYYTVFISCTVTSQRSLESIPELFGDTVEPANIKPVAEVDEVVPSDEK